MTSIRASCFSMCPRSERNMREREGLLHVLEIDDATKNMKKPRADPAKIIKCYSRSGAGMSKSEPSQLRPGPVLFLTVRYLLTKIITRSDIKWTRIYEFIFDRLRAVRQDMVVQRLDISTSIVLLEPIVKFHIYSSQRLCEESLAEYVPKFNDQHLLECIKQLLVMYDEADRLELQQSKLSKSSRTTIEALYILLYLGDHESLNRGLSLPKKIKELPEVQNALRISLAWHTRNYVKVCKGIRNLPSLLAIAALNSMSHVRRNALAIMSSAYNCQNLTFPGSKVEEILLYEEFQKVVEDCKLFGLRMIDRNICFEKKNFKVEILLANPENHFTDTILHSLLPKVLIN